MKGKGLFSSQFGGSHPRLGSLLTWPLMRAADDNDGNAGWSEWPHCKPGSRESRTSRCPTVLFEVMSPMS